MVGAAAVGLGEEEYRGRDAGVWLEDAARKLDDRVELLVLDENATQLLVRSARAEKDAVGDDHACSAARAQ
jgi:hypothetical protein